MVTSDETGRVIVATAMPGTVASLREAAVEAAYKALFKPVIVADRAVVAPGLIEYRFVLPK